MDDIVHGVKRVGHDRVTFTFYTPKGEYCLRYRLRIQAHGSLAAGQLAVRTGLSLMLSCASDIAGHKLWDLVGMKAKSHS